MPGPVGGLVSLLLLISAPVGAEITPIDATRLEAELTARQGQVVLVNFWATWCRPCLKEIPDLMELATELADDGFALVAVSLDDAAAPDETIQPFLDRWFPGFSTYLSLEADMDAMVSVIDMAWNEVLPTSYVLARDGSVALRIQGGSSKEKFAEAIRQVL